MTCSWWHLILVIQLKVFISVHHLGVRFVVKFHSLHLVAELWIWAEYSYRTVDSGCRLMILIRSCLLKMFANIFKLNFVVGCGDKLTCSRVKARPCASCLAWSILRLLSSKIKKFTKYIRCFFVWWQLYQRCACIDSLFSFIYFL